MNPIRRLSSLTILLCVSVFHLGSTDSARTSLWGKKVLFDVRPCLWQLHPDAVIPALKELSVCILLRRKIATPWTGFVYKAPGGRDKTELGLGGVGSHLAVWLFGEEHRVERELLLKEWHSVCLTWSGQTQRLRIYINGTCLNDTYVNPILPQQLAQNGTLTLGVSHYVDANDKVQQESSTNLLGEIGLFRIWAREWGPEELRNQSCVDGDVVSWDQLQWKYSCPATLDSSLHCAWSPYKIKMWVLVHSTSPKNSSLSLEGLTRNWLESVFPSNISVRDISVSSPSCTCHVVNNSAILHVQQPQGSRALSNSTCDECTSFSCEVYVDVNPPTNVEVVQANVTALLSLTFSYDFFNLTADANSIRILPVESCPAVTEPAPTGRTKPSPTQTLPALPTKPSTTEESSDFNYTAAEPDTFFKVKLTLNMTGNPAYPKVITEKWVKEALEVNGTMHVLNLIIKDTAGRNMKQYNELTMFHGQQKQYYAAFHVQEHKVNSVAEIQTFINAALTSKYENGSIIIQAFNVEIKHIIPHNCLAGNTSSIFYGQYLWPEALPQKNLKTVCIKPRSERASRLCKLDIETDTTSWAKPDMTNCNPIVTISGLDNITVTNNNVAEVVEAIQDLVALQLGNNKRLSSSELHSVVGKLNEVIDVTIINTPVCSSIVNIVAKILLSETDVTPVANIVINMTDRMGDNVDFEDEFVSLTAPSMALSMINVDPDGFSGLTFGVSSISSLLTPETFLKQSFVSQPLHDTVAAISLPHALHSFFPSGERNTARVQFQFYATHDLFQDRYTTNSTQSSWTLNSYVVSASINNSDVNKLKDRVVVTLSHQKPTQTEDKVQCMFWDFQMNDGQGGWNSRGCETQSISSHQTSCLCDHLTHFAVLLDVSRTPISEADSHILTVISHLGCGISSLFLAITLLTYLGFEKVRRDYPSKILINLSVALLGLCMVFLLDPWFSSFSIYGLCIATGATLHYFLLASFTWMGLEAVHMYFALVKVFNTYVPSYILKFCAVGWGIPLVIVGLVLAIDKDAYGSGVPEETGVRLQSTDPLCWLQKDIFFYVAVVAFIFLILFCNISVFILVLIQIRQMKTNNPAVNRHSALHDLRAAASLNVLLGLTWSISFFSFGPGRVVLMYLFSILNTLQGFFIFLFHCLMKENVRKQWKIHLCCGRFRLKDYSDWSCSATVGGHSINKNPVNSDSLAFDNTSTIRKDSNSSPSNHHHQGA